MSTTYEPQHPEDRVEDRDRAIGAVSVRGKPVRKTPLAWLPWVALALLALLALASLLVARNVGDAGDGPGVVAGGKALLPLPGSGLASLSGQTVEGTSVNVQSVVADEGFWVGDDTTNRIFLFLTDEAMAAEGESPFQVAAGQRVSFTGTLRPLPEDLTPFGVDKREGSDQLREQDHYVEVTKVALG